MLLAICVTIKAALSRKRGGRKASCAKGTVRAVVKGTFLSKGHVPLREFHSPSVSTSKEVERRANAAYEARLGEFGLCHTFSTTRVGACRQIGKISRVKLCLSKVCPNKCPNCCAPLGVLFPFTRLRAQTNNGKKSILFPY